MLKQQSQCPHSPNHHQEVQEDLSLESTVEQSPKREVQSAGEINLQCKVERKSVASSKQDQRTDVIARYKEKEQSKSCMLHNMQLQIFCMTDRVRICPHCALFSTHRQHELRPVKQVAKTIKSFIQQFKHSSQRKLKLDHKLKSSDFRQAMIATVTAHKNSLIADIKHKFKQLQENIKLAEKRAFDDVAKSFKSIAKQIAMIDRQEQHSNLLYQKWELTCQQLLQISSFEQKAYMLAAGNLDVLKEGQSIVAAMEQKADTKIQTIQRIVKSIKVQQNQAVPNSIFNYINIQLEQQLQKTSESLEVVKQQQEQEIIQFNSVKIIREPSSPLTHSRKRGNSASQNSDGNGLRKSMNRKPSKLQLVTPVQFQIIVSQFCSKENLETLDLTNCGLLDTEVLELLDFIKSKKKIKSLKLSKNKLTNEGFSKMLDLIPVVTNLNLSFNHLSEDSVYELLKKRPKVPHLRIVNLSSNSINQRRCQNAIEQLKKQGIIVTI